MGKDEFLLAVNQSIIQGVNVYQTILDNTFQNYYCIALDCSQLVEPIDDDKLPDGIVTHFLVYSTKMI